MGDKDQVGTGTSLYYATVGEVPFREVGGSMAVSTSIDIKTDAPPSDYEALRDVFPRARHMTITRNYADDTECVSFKQPIGCIRTQSRCRPVSIFSGPFGTITFDCVEADPRIEDVIHNGPATVVKWSDGRKTVVKCHKEDEYNERVGLLACAFRRAMRNRSTSPYELVTYYVAKWFDTRAMRAFAKALVAMADWMDKEGK